MPLAPHLKIVDARIDTALIKESFRKLKTLNILLFVL